MNMHYIYNGKKIKYVCIYVHVIFLVEEKDKILDILNKNSY